MNGSFVQQAQRFSEGQRVALADAPWQTGTVASTIHHRYLVRWDRRAGGTIHAGIQLVGAS